MPIGIRDFAGDLCRRAARAGQDGVLRNEFGVWGAYSASAQNIQGSVSNLQFGVAAFRYARILHSSPGYAIEYTVDIDPVEVMRQNTWMSCIVSSGGIPIGTYCPAGRETVYGGGISPIGWKFNFMRSRRWQPLLASTGGLIASERPIPKDIPMATQFNFTFDFQAGVEYFNSSRTRAWCFVAKDPAHLQRQPQFGKSRRQHHHVFRRLLLLQVTSESRIAISCRDEACILRALCASAVNPAFGSSAYNLPPITRHLTPLLSSIHPADKTSPATQSRPATA